MGTHPIFESDFDCLTDCFRHERYCICIAEYAKGARRPSRKSKQSTEERDEVGKRIGQFEAQLSETKVVLSELELIGDDSTVYKLLGPVLVKQEKEIAMQTIQNRKNFMESEIKKSENQIEKMSKSLAKEQDALRELHMKSQQFKQALQHHSGKQ